MMNDWSRIARDKDVICGRPQTITWWEASFRNSGGAKEGHGGAKAYNISHMPSRSEIDEHMLTHIPIPFRSWCPHCVKGKAKGRHHRLIKRHA